MEHHFFNNTIERAVINKTGMESLAPCQPRPNIPATIAAFSLAITYTKKCPVCNGRKLFSFFYKNKRNRDGHDYYCKSCFNKKP